MQTIYDQNFTRIVLEIPHRFPESAWLAYGEDDLKETLIKGFTDSEYEEFYELDEGYSTDVTVEQLLEIAGSDLQKLKVFETVDEARTYALVDRLQGFAKVLKVLEDADALLFQVSYEGLSGTEYETFAGGCSQDNDYQKIADIAEQYRILAVDYVTTEGVVLSSAYDDDDIADINEEASDNLYAIVQEGICVWGTGSTIPDCIDDANKWFDSDQQITGFEDHDHLGSEAGRLTDRTKGRRYEVASGDMFITDDLEIIRSYERDFAEVKI